MINLDALAKIGQDSPLATIRNDRVAFRGARFFLSNFFPTPVTINGIEYPSSEHAYQATKAVGTQDHDFIRSAPTPAEAKRRASPRVLHTIRPDWNDIRVDIMRSVLEAKFENHGLREQLLATGDDPLVEINTWGDVFWGQCPKGSGENWLGRLLMELRQELQDPDHARRKAYIERYSVNPPEH